MPGWNCDSMCVFNSPAPHPISRTADPFLARPFNIFHRRIRKYNNIRNTGSSARRRLAYLRDDLDSIACHQSGSDNFLRRALSRAHTTHLPVCVDRSATWPCLHGFPVKNRVKPASLASPLVINPAADLASLRDTTTLPFFTWARSREQITQAIKLTIRSQTCPLGQGLLVRYLVRPSRLASAQEMMAVRGSGIEGVPAHPRPFLQPTQWVSDVRLSATCPWGHGIALKYRSNPRATASFRD